MKTEDSLLTEIEEGIQRLYRFAFGACLVAMIFAIIAITAASML